jgi:hypothetical protein
MREFVDISVFLLVSGAALSWLAGTVIPLLAAGGAVWSLWYIAGGLTA